MIVLDPPEDFAKLPAYFPESEHLAGVVNDVNAPAVQKKQEQSGMVMIEPVFGRFHHHCPTYIAPLFFVSGVSGRNSLFKSPLQQWPLHSPSNALVMMVDDAPHRHG